MGDDLMQDDDLTYYGGMLDEVTCTAPAPNPDEDKKTAGLSAGAWFGIGAATLALLIVTIYLICRK